MAKPQVHPRFTLFVKGSPEKPELGDCPFCHRCMLTLQEKGVGYHKVLVDEKNMPSWIGEVNPNGPQIPIALDHSNNKFIEDSGNIVTLVEREYPEPKLGTPDSCSKVGEGLMPAFMDFLKEGGSKEQGLRTELGKIEDALKSSGGPYLAGDHPCAACFAYAPRLHHAQIAAKAIQDWNGFNDYPHINKFLDAMRGRDSWRATQYTDKYLIDGWNLKISS